MNLRFLSTRKTFLILIWSLLICGFACKKNEIDPVIVVPVIPEKHDTFNIPHVKSFAFLAVNNLNIYQDITFIKQEDSSFLANVPFEVDLSKIIPTFDYTGKVEMNGMPVTSGKTALNIPDENTIFFDGKPLKFIVKRSYTIPIMYINTQNKTGVKSKTNYVYCTVKIDGRNIYKDFYSDFSDSARIRGRGNSTWEYYSKKPYRLELGSKNALLGMKKAKDWVLLANYRDPTNFMNAVAFDMARYLEMPYTNSNRFVEIYLDSGYIGLYHLTEQIEQGQNRVAIDENNGVLINLDLDDGPTYQPTAGDNFISDIFFLPIGIKYPENPTRIQIDAIKEDFAELEQYIEDVDFTNLQKRLDIGSLIDFLIIQEMTRNVELVTPRSMYMYKDADNIYHFGPVWDFDGGFAFDWASMSTGHGYFGSNSWLMGSENPALHPFDNYNYIPDFFVNMFNSKEFVSAYQKRWAEVKVGMLNYCFTQLDDYVKHCSTAIVNNSKKWPVKKNSLSEIQKMKDWLSKRAANYTDVIANY